MAPPSLRCLGPGPYYLPLLIAAVLAEVGVVGSVSSSKRRRAPGRIRTRDLQVQVGTAQHYRKASWCFRPVGMISGVFDGFRSIFMNFRMIVNENIRKSCIMAHVSTDFDGFSLIFMDFHVSSLEINENIYKFMKNRPKRSSGFALA